MKKIFKNKIFISVCCVILCLVLSSVVLAEVIPTLPKNVTLNVEWDNVIRDEFVGSGANSWVVDLCDESESKLGMTEAHADLNFKRIATIPAACVRYYFQANYVMYLDDADAGEAKWNAGDLNFESDTYKGFVAACRTYKDVGTRVIFNWGSYVPAKVAKWFGIDNVPDEKNGRRSAPDNLEVYAENMAKTLYQLRVVEGLTNIDVVNYHNEITYSDFATFVDKKVIWIKWLELAHKALKKYGLRDQVTVLGLDSADGYGFDGYYGEDEKDPWKSAEFYKYVSENAKDPVTGEKYYDGLSIHIYLNSGRPTRQIDTRTNPVNGYVGGAKHNYENVLKWFPDMWLTEWGNSTADKKSDPEGWEWSHKNSYEVSRAGQFIAQANAGFQASFQWGYFGGLFPEGFSHIESYSEDVNAANPEAAKFQILWNSPSSDGTAGGNRGYDKVSRGFGEMGLLFRYVPRTNSDLNTVAKVVSSTSSSDDVRIAAFTSETSGQNARKDVTIVVETNENSGKKNYEINIAKEYQGLKFKKYVFEYPEGYFVSGEGGSTYDANAVLNPGVSVSVSDGKITDSVDDKHYMIVYSTLDEAQQVYFEKPTDVQQYVAPGGQFKYSTIKFEGFENDPQVKYTIKTGSEYASIDQNGVLKVNDNAPEGKWISVKVAAEGENVKTNEAYAIALVKITSNNTSN